MGCFTLHDEGLNAHELTPKQVKLPQRNKGQFQWDTKQRLAEAKLPWFGHLEHDEFSNE